MKKFLFLSVLSLLCNVWAVTYYVSPEGNDRNPGTNPAKPLKSIALAFRRCKAGDTVMLKGGIYHEQPGADWRGKNKLPIRIKPFPDETPVITWGWDVTNWRKLPGGLFAASFPYAACELWQRITLDRYLKVNSMKLLKNQPGSFFQDVKDGTIYVNPLNGSWHSDPENAGFTAIPYTDGSRPRPFNATTRLGRAAGMNLVGHNVHVEGVSLEFHHGKAFYLRGRQLDQFFGSGSIRNSTAVGSTCGVSTGWHVDGVVIENCRAIRNSGAGLHLGEPIKNVKVINNFLLNNGSSLPFYGNYTAGSGNVYNLARYGGKNSEYVDVIGNKVISLDNSRGGGVMRFKGGISKHTNQLNNLFVGGGVVLYSVPGSTATIRNNTVVPGKFNFTVPNTGLKYAPDMKDNLELPRNGKKNPDRFVNPEKYDYRLLADSKHLGKGFAPAAAPVWFVRPGAAQGSGRTPEKPLNSLAELQKKIKSGDTVYFMKGEYKGTLSLKGLKNVTLSDKSFNTALWNGATLGFDNCSEITVENMDFKKGKISLKNSSILFKENLFENVAFNAAAGKLVLSNNRLLSCQVASSGRVVYRENILSALKSSAKEVVSEHNGFMTAQELKEWKYKETFKSFVAGVNGTVPLKNIVRGSRGTWIGGRVIPDVVPPLEVKYIKATPLSCGTKAVISWNTPKDYVKVYLEAFEGKKLVWKNYFRFGNYLSCSNAVCIPGLKPGTRYRVTLAILRHNEERPLRRTLNFTTSKPAGARKSAVLEVGAGKKYSSVAEAVLAAGNGDTVLVHPGTYPEMIDVYSDNVTIKSVKPGTVKFSAEYMFDYSLQAANVKKLTIEGIDFVGARYSGSAKLIGILNSEQVRIINCRFHAGLNRRMGNLHIFGRFVKGFEVKNCVFDTGFHSIWLLESSDVVIDHNTFWGIGINAIHVGGGDGAKVTITNNLCEDVVSNHISPAISVGHNKTKLVCDWNLYWNTKKRCPHQKIFGMGGKLGILSVGQVMRQDAYVTIEECRKHYGIEKNGLYADPRMKDPAKGDFSLAPDSPARKRGSDGKDIGADLSVFGIK